MLCESGENDYAKLFFVKTLRITPILRKRLKNPLGELAAGTVSECNSALRESIRLQIPTKTVLVGDTVSRNAVIAGINPDVIVIDNREMRREAQSFTFGDRKRFHLSNLPGAISSDSWNILAEAIQTGNAAVIVRGEEDLLVLVAISISPIDSLVVYGQPHVGIVLVTVSDKKKEEIAELVKMMDSTSV